MAPSQYVKKWGTDTWECLVSVIGIDIDVCVCLSVCVCSTVFGPLGLSAESISCLSVSAARLKVLI